jgi:hypothetical protein
MNHMEKENINLLMELFMMENGLMIYKMDKEKKFV